MQLTRTKKALLCLLSVFCVCMPALPVHAEEESPRDVQVPVIMYHSLHDSISDMWTLPPDQFEADLRYLRDNGYRAVDMADLAAFVYEGSPLPEKPIVLTFDDGYYNNYTKAMPLLEKYDMKIVLSVIGEHADTWSQEPGTDEKDGHCTWEQLREMAATGRVELANHTQALHSNKDGRHGCVRMSGEDLDSYCELLYADIQRLQDSFREHCDATPICFAYPFGSSCVEASDALREMGFLATLSCYEGMNVVRYGDPDCLFDLHRCNRTNDSPVWAILERIA